MEPENVTELVDEVLEYIFYVDLLGNQVRQLKHEALVHFRPERCHLIVCPVKIEEVFNSSDVLLAHGLTFVVLRQKSYPFGKILVLPFVIHSFDIVQNLHQVVKNDGEDDHSEQENACTDHLFIDTFG